MWAVTEEFDDLENAPQIDSWDKVSYINRPVEIHKEDGNSCRVENPPIATFKLIIFNVYLMSFSSVGSCIRYRFSFILSMVYDCTVIDGVRQKISCC